MSGEPLQMGDRRVHRSIPNEERRCPQSNDAPGYEPGMCPRLVPQAHARESLKISASDQVCRFSSLSVLTKHEGVAQQM
jgi:hypothetical protein